MLTRATDPVLAATGRSQETFRTGRRAAVGETTGIAEPAHEQVARRAYEIWRARGDGEGDALSDWLTAERELRNDAMTVGDMPGRYRLGSMSPMTGRPWVVVLAGGEGQRVSALTRDEGGRIVPKQYFSFGGRAPMLRWSLARARRIAPALRVLVVVNEHHRVFWERELADIPLSLVVQPCNRGTAAGVLLALLEIRARGGAASPVVFLPSDHYVADEDVLHDALLAALRAARRHAREALLLGMKPTEIDHGYGWILPATGHRIARVCQFVEKPSLDTVAQMLLGGALINSFILVALVEALLDIFEQSLPGVLQEFRRCVSVRPANGELQRLYAGLPCADLSRDVLARTPRSLSVVRVPPCGWSDLGTPERLQQFLAEAHPRRAPSPAMIHSATLA